MLWMEPWKWPISFVPTLAALGFALCYHVGGEDVPPTLKREMRTRSATFYVGLLVLWIALDSPMDSLSDRSFAWHMTQHMVLMLVSPPLLLLGAPLRRLERSRVLFAAKSAKAARLQLMPTKSDGKGLAESIVGRLSPSYSFFLFAASLVVTHLPGPYDYALSHEWYHNLEHLEYILVSLLYWAKVIESPPLSAIASFVQRGVYILAGVALFWIVGLILAFSPTPLYHAYLQLQGASRASVLSDQQLGAAIMWGPSMIPFDVFLARTIQQWLSKSQRDDIVQAAMMAMSNTSGKESLSGDETLQIPWTPAEGRGSRQRDLRQ